MEIALVPGTLLRRLAAEEEDRTHLNFLLSGVLVLAGLGYAARRPAAAGRLPHICLSQKLLGVPCPGCGVTRSLLAMARGDVAASLRHNPAGALVFAHLAAQVPLRALALARADAGGAVEAASKELGGAVLATLLLVWAVRVARVLAR